VSHEAWLQDSLGPQKQLPWALQRNLQQTCDLTKVYKDTKIGRRVGYASKRQHSYGASCEQLVQY
jgi:hypothetical protein